MNVKRPLASFSVTGKVKVIVPMCPHFVKSVVKC